MKVNSLVSNLAILVVLFAPAAWAGDQAHETTTGATVRRGMSNSDLEKQVKTALKDDERLAASNIDVTAKDHVIYLSGTVDSRVDRDRAVKVAKNVDGVSDVQDKIMISNGSR